MSITILLACLIFNFTPSWSDEMLRDLIISNGVVRGAALQMGSEEVWQFLGIPFAQKPTGSLRFARPKPFAKKWRHGFDATRIPNRCLEIALDSTIPHSPSNHGPYSEDCLTLNVWTPRGTSKRPTSLPVMVWIHGGSFTMGSAFPEYNGRALSFLGRVVVVTIQYRLGAFGFWTPDVHSGANWGLWDQQLALRWVRENIAAFGGDPQLVTIFGESAGGASVSFHLLNSDSRRLFRRAIAQSGSSLAPWAFTKQAKAISAEYRHFAESFGCKNVAAMTSCMRNLDASLLLKQSAGKSWVPVADGAFLTDTPSKIIQTLPSDHDYMLGVNQNEGWGFMTIFMERMRGQIPMRITEDIFFGNYPEAPLELHNVTRFALEQRLKTHENVSNLYESIKRSSIAVSESLFFCPAASEADLYVQNGTRVFVYQFAHRPSYSPYPPTIGSTHGEEIPFVFAFDLLNVLNFTAADSALSRSMIRDWSTFARSGQPANTAWKPYSVEAKEFTKLAIRPEQKTFFYKRNDCAFWNFLLPLIDSLARREEKSGASEMVGSIANVVISMLCAAFILL